MTQTAVQISKTFNLIGEFNNCERIIIRNSDDLSKKLNVIRSMGKENLSIYSDFDYTLTINNIEGKNADSTFSVLSHSELVSEKYRKELKNLYLKYSPLEKSTTISDEQKQIYMNTWWKEAQILIIQEKLDKSKIRNAIRNSSLKFRNGIIEFIKSCSNFSIPLYIVSAGLGSIIKESIEMIWNQLNINEKSFIKYVFSEDLYNKEGILYDFLEPLVTSQNKNEILKAKCQSVRPNAIIIGDLIVDQTMVKDLNLTNKLSIGYYNSIENDPHLLENYCKSFDIVITNEGNLSSINYLLNKIFEPNTSSEGICPQSKEIFDSLFQ